MLFLNAAIHIRSSLLLKRYLINIYCIYLLSRAFAATTVKRFDEQLILSIAQLLNF